MNIATNQPTVISSTTKRIILASANKHERHSTSRQERALKTIRKMGRYEEDEVFTNRRVHRISSADEGIND